LTENVKTLALLDVYGRTVKALENLAVEENGQKLIRDKLSHQDLSSLVGSSREMVSKIMKDLTVGGYISVDGKTLRIHRNFPSSW
jgi:CRP/FNR family cyclic AMP-dependent transcriptional regulator